METFLLPVYRDLPDLLGHQERKDTLDSQDQWDHQEHVESAERSDPR